MGNDRNPWGACDARGVAWEQERERNRQEQARNDKAWSDHYEWQRKFQKEQAASSRNTNSKPQTETTLICTELHRQGLLTTADLRLSHEDALKRLTAAHRRGYHFWAVGIVRTMRKSPRTTRAFRRLAQARVDEIAARNGDTSRANLLGKLLIAIGEPTCLLVGRFVGETDYRALYGPGFSPKS